MNTEINRGLLAYLDPASRAVLEAEQAEWERRRDYAASRLAELYFCTTEAARCWLDVNDAEAIETAKRLMNAEPYTAIAVEHSYH